MSIPQEKKEKWYAAVYLGNEKMERGQYHWSDGFDKKIRCTN